MSGRKLFGKRDLLLFAALFAAAALAYGVYAMANRGGGEAYAEIAVDGHVTQTVRLTEDRAFALPENPHIHFEIHDGAIAFVESDCPDQVCVHAGYLRRAGQTAVCLPNRVSVTIVAPRGQSDVDMIAN